MAIALATLLYPVLIYFGQKQIAPRTLSLLLVVLVLARLWQLKSGSGTATRTRLLATGAALAVAVAAVAAIAYWSIRDNALLPLQLYPALVNLVLLAVFGYSLLVPPTIIERLARRGQTAPLPPFAIRYTRHVTQVWCVFFLINGSMALGTALWASPATWSLYTGVISYVLMGLLFAIEYAVRLFVRRHHAA